MPRTLKRLLPLLCILLALLALAAYVTEFNQLK